MPRTRTERSRLAPLALACSLALLAGCATAPRQANAARTELPRPADDWSASERALRDGDWGGARQSLARLLQQDLRNGHLQFLHALAEENEARGGDRARLELASVGYANAVRFAPGQYWALLHLGFLELERDEFGAAQNRFAEAAMDQPGRWEAFYGLGVASYFGRDLPMLALAAARAHELAPDEPETQRLQALAAPARTAAPPDARTWKGASASSFPWPIPCRTASPRKTVSTPAMQRPPNPRRHPTRWWSKSPSCSAPSSTRPRAA